MITNPALKYYGGKWNIGKWVISHFPKHHHYIEVCGGAASVLLQKERSKVETYNDVDKNVVAYFRMLRDKPNELLNLINLTPWARDEYDLQRNDTKSDISDLERARRFWVGCQMSIVGMAQNKSGFKIHKGIGKGGRSHKSKYKTSHLMEIAKRFKRVQIENLPYQELITRYDYDDNLMYIDPPLC